ncbi:MAG: TRAP transporter substrate-binding protein [Kofleriaceae bacterium]|nr:TRAP transporter substrate-binding protein [Myxococcales bacterium]MCB9559237.1 TRAP transporter substrate-binding protein [Kofleriaceae bacterium]MCB9574871.1 TRAP transporter substrate-binding protein [Kofleriaceae bacterium]
MLNKVLGHLGITVGRAVAVAALTVAAAIVTAPAAHADTKYEMKIATVAPDNTAWATVLKEYKKNVEKASGGRIKIRIFLGGMLTDDENNSVRMLVRGQVEAIGASTGSVATIVKELEAIEIPFLFKTSKEADFVLDKYIKDEVKDLFRANDMVFGFWSENGFRHFAASWGPVLEPADLKNQKVRSQESFPHLEMWKALGAAAQAIPTGEVKTALKTGSVDGYDQSLLYSIAGSWHQHIKHLTLSAHIYQPAVIAFNKAWFDGLPTDLQKVLIDEGEALVRKGRKAIRDMNPKLLDIIKGEGVKVHTLTDAQRADFEKATAGVRDKVAARSDGHKKLVELIEKGLADYRSKGKKKK